MTHNIDAWGYMSSFTSECDQRKLLELKLTKNRRRPNPPVMIVISIHVFAHLVTLRFSIIASGEVHVVLDIEVPNGLDFRLSQELPPLLIRLDGFAHFVSLLPFRSHELQHSEIDSLFMQTTFTRFTLIRCLIVSGHDEFARRFHESSKHENFVAHCLSTYPVDDCDRENYNSIDDRSAHVNLFNL